MFTEKIKVDKNTGWIIEAKINQEMKGETQVNATPQMPDGMTIPMMMNNEINFTDH